MSFSYGSGIIGSKLREEMYLRHLRQVEKINNREPDSLRKSLKYYKSINSCHKNNKIRAYNFRLSEEGKKIYAKNQEIYKKII